MYGDEIKKARLELEMTQMQVSKITGIPQNTISWIESDKGIPNIQQCVQLADCYNISIDELIGRNKAEKKQTYNNYGIHTGDVKF